jgi:hypothetical protein
MISRPGELSHDPLFACYQMSYNLFYLKAIMLPPQPWCLILLLGIPNDPGPPKTCTTARVWVFWPAWLAGSMRGVSRSRIICNLCFTQLLCLQLSSQTVHTCQLTNGPCLGGKVVRSGGKCILGISARVHALCKLSLPSVYTSRTCRHRC